MTKHKHSFARLPYQTRYVLRSELAVDKFGRTISMCGHGPFGILTKRRYRAWTWCSSRRAWAAALALAPRPSWPSWCALALS
eukprot:3984216-Pleurochrysis_carterae.AAC.1